MVVFFNGHLFTNLMFYCDWCFKCILMILRRIMLLFQVNSILNCDGFIVFVGTKVLDADCFLLCAMVGAAES